VGGVAVRGGEQVDKGAPIVRLVPSPRMAASYAQALSALQVAQQLVARTRTLVEGHLATRQQLAEAEKLQSDSEAALAALKAQGAGGTQILRAPFAAIVTAVSASPGAIVAEGAALVQLARPNGLVLRAGVVPARAAAVKPGDKVRIMPLGASTAAAGTVLLRGAVVDPASGLVPVEITLPRGRFIPGETATAAITTGEVRGFVVPHAAILVDDAGATYVVQAVDMRAKKVAVRVLGSDGAQDVIAGPLDAASPLVLAGNYQIENGMRVRVADPQQGAQP